MAKIAIGWLIIAATPFSQATQQFDDEFQTVVRELSKAKIPRPEFKSFERGWEMAQDIHFRVYEVVKNICAEEGIPSRNCKWSISVSRSPSFNAYASVNNKIVISSGLIDQITYEDELAFVIAHEIAHHLLDHIRKGTALIFTGQILGTVLLNDATGGLVMASLMRSLPSRKFESNADAIAMKIVSSAGYDLNKARFVLMRMAKINPHLKSRLLDSHPAGLERIVSFDQRIKAP